MQVNDVRTKEDLIAFLEEMAKSRKKGAEGWANPELADYLSAAARWTEGLERVYANTGKKLPKDIDWQLIAALFNAGKIYE